jgi:transposase InsO family protein
VGGKRGRLIAEQDKAEVINLIQEACAAGSRIEPACAILELNIRTLQRWQREDEGLKDKRRGPVTAPANKLTNAERALILEVANSAEYCNQPPSQIVPNLADKEIYIASESSFYRVLKQANLLQHRSASRPRTHRKPDELSATKSNQLWSWDITYLPSTVRGKYFYLYLFEDIFSRKIVGFDVFDEESAEHASTVISAAYKTEGLRNGDVILHSDNGSPMKGSTMLATLKGLGIVPSFSRPSVSDDNPYSESLFKTLKYCPQYPKKPFASVADARAWVLKFVDWYNNIHQHSGINFVTPNARHQGLDIEILKARTRVYKCAKERSPNRWSRQTRNWQHIGEVYLNKKITNRKTA